MCIFKLIKGSHNALIFAIPVFWCNCHEKANGRHDTYHFSKLEDTKRYSLILFKTVLQTSFSIYVVHNVFQLFIYEIFND